MIKEFLRDLVEFQVKEMELAAIWLNKPLQTATERTVRITEGHQVRVENGKLVDCGVDGPTHKIIGCYGTVSSSTLSLALINLKTAQPDILLIK